MSLDLIPNCQYYSKFPRIVQLAASNDFAVEFALEFLFKKKEQEVFYLFDTISVNEYLCREYDDWNGALN